MRPSLLTISAWGPYPKQVTIDFTKFEEGSIFLVTGPTGAGKTTIFDAISYALYGNVSGMNREKTTVRSDFAELDAETYVEFTFTHKGKEYQIFRTPKYERPKKRGEGFTTSAESAVLKIENEPPIASVQEVNKKVEEIMGINYEQFKQIAMIAQGEFLNLLYAKSEDKVEIFRNLFKTQIYDRMLKALTERSKNLYVRIKEHTNKMDEAIAGIDCGTNEELQTSIQVEDKNYEQIIELLKEENHENTLKAKACKKEMEQIDAIYVEQLSSLTKATELNETIEQLGKVRQALEKLLEQQSLIEQMKNKVGRARLAQTVAIDEQLYVESCRLQKQIEQRMNDTMQLLEQLKVEAVQLEHEFMHSKELEEELGKCRQQLQWLESLLPLLKTLEEKEMQQIQCVKHLEERLQKEDQLKTGLQNLKEAKEKLTIKKRTYETVDTRLGEVRVKIEQAKQLYQSLQNALKLLETLRQQEIQLQEIQERYLLEESKLNAIKEAYESKEKLYRQAAVGLAARFLVDNEPCPVCGSLEHPKKAVISHEVPDEAELEKEKLIYEKAQYEFQAIYNQASTMKGALESKKEELDRILAILKINDSNELIAAFTKTKEDSLVLIEERNQLEKLQEERESCNQKLELCEKQLEEVEKQLVLVGDDKAKLQSEKDMIAGTIANIKLQLPEEFTRILKVEAELNVVRDKIEGFVKEIDHIRNKKEQLYAKQKSTEVLLESHEAQRAANGIEVEQRHITFINKLEESGFISSEDYETAKIQSNELTQMEQSIEKYNEQLLAYQEQEKHLAQRTQGKEKADVESLKLTLETTRKQKQELQILSEALAAKFSYNKKAYDSIKEKIEKISTLSETYGYVKDLENAAKGSNSERIVFEHYVLAAYFEDILVAANLRLSAMTNKRYELMKVSKVNDQRTKNSLDLEVLDNYTGKRRPVKTLSGGESFKAALSLALGLSDIIQQNAGGIEIHTLFIDEGFGSLDSESLDQALKSLMNLTGQNKLIGIISHVSELKERIDNQIVIEKDQCGSKLKVVC